MSDQEAPGTTLLIYTEILSKELSADKIPSKVCSTVCISMKAGKLECYRPSALLSHYAITKILFFLFKDWIHLNYFRSKAKPITQRNGMHLKQ